jgi:adenosine kinase
VWKKAKIAYSAGFFITVSVPSMLEVAAYCQQDASRRFAINLSAPFIPQFFFDPLNELISFADILLGNESVCTLALGSTHTTFGSTPAHST